MAITQRLANPILEREALTRARSWSTPVTMTLYLCLLGAFALAMFSRAISGAPDKLPAAEDMANAAFLIVGFQLVLALLFVPALAAGAIAGERERGTLDMLVLSHLRPFDLAWGKLAAAVAYPVVLVVVSLPIVMSAFLYAGLDLGQLAITQVLTLVTAITLGAVATFLSAVSPSTVVATVGSYVAALGLYVVTVLLGAIPADDGKTGLWGSVHPLLFANPFYALTAVTTAFEPAGASLGELFHRLILRGGTPTPSGLVLQPWQLGVLAQVVITAICLAATGRVLSRRSRRPRKRAESPAGATSDPVAAAS
ncbi:MAG: ABC transporter permease subunit [Acidimicrobiales bacterium]